MTAPLISSHVYRPDVWKPPAHRTGGCGYLGCGRPADAHERAVSGKHRPPACDDEQDPDGAR